MGEQQNGHPKAPITPAEARTAWEAVDRPSSRKVAAVLSHNGRRVSHTTVSGWQRNGWTIEDRPTARRVAKCVTRSKGKADRVVPLATGAPADTTANLPAIEDISGATDVDLLQKTCREGLDAARRIFFQIKNSPALVADKPAAVGSLMQAAGDVFGKAAEGLRRASEMRFEIIQREGGMKDVTPPAPVPGTPRPRETDPLAPALELWEKVARGEQVNG